MGQRLLEMLSLVSLFTPPLIAFRVLIATLVGWEKQKAACWRPPTQEKRRLRNPGVLAVLCLQDRGPCLPRGIFALSLDSIV